MRATGRWGLVFKEKYDLFIVVNTIKLNIDDNKGGLRLQRARWGLVFFIVVITIKYTYNSLIDMGGLRLQRAIETDIQ